MPDRLVSPPLVLESELERRIVAHPDWQTGVTWIAHHPGHRDGETVGIHIAEVLANVDVEAPAPETRRQLRLIALLHDTLKYRSPGEKPEIPQHSHGEVARDFALEFFGEDFAEEQSILDVIYVHDEALIAWELGMLQDKWDEAIQYASEIIEFLGDGLDLFLHFNRCDTRTGYKIRDSLRWFEGFVCGTGRSLPRQRLTLVRHERRLVGDR